MDILKHHNQLLVSAVVARMNKEGSGLLGAEGTLLAGADYADPDKNTKPSADNAISG